MFTYTLLTYRPPKLRLPRKLGKIKMAKIDKIFLTALLSNFTT